ncbi:N-6 DNA methylase [Loktanella sp. DJP18]|uniref:N-6 DNA methylase n=1 Tax=Loktanella sp. DJP18 TaxID=3409788 RepID=UPI003BB67987
MVDLLLADNDDALSGKSIIRRVYDPACGTGGLLSVAEDAMKEMNPGLNVDLFGQELNGEFYAICKSDMLVTRTWLLAGHRAQYRYETKSRVTYPLLITLTIRNAGFGRSGYPV